MIIISYSCDKKEEHKFAFYHWKSKANNSTAISNALSLTKTSTIYLHYFDVDKKIHDDELFPISVLKHIDEPFKKYIIIPVIFISNNALKKADISQLSDKILKLTDEISEFHLGKKFYEIQLDCDWTQSTKQKYFKLIECLKKHYKVTATIRLHQIKFQNKTGIPPVDKGVLMLYNIGKLDSVNQNSIIQSSIVKKYINRESNYPIKLDVALPLYSQTILINKQNKLRLIKNVDREMIDGDSKHFRKINTNLYEVSQDTLYKGFYLTKGYNLKLEETTEDEIISSFKVFENSKLNYDKIIFYHLDDKTLKNIDLEKIINQL